MSEIKAVKHATEAEKKENEAYEAIARYRLDPDQELFPASYAEGIAAFENFLKTYPASRFAEEIQKRLNAWKEETGALAAGKVKFANVWMSWQEKAMKVALRNLQKLQSQLESSQKKREKMVADVQQAELELKRLEETVPGIPDNTVIEGLNKKRTVIPNKDKAKLMQELTFYRRQVPLWRQALADLEAKLRDLQTKVGEAQSKYDVALVNWEAIPTAQRDAETSETAITAGIVPNNAFDAIMLYCRKTKLPLSLDPDVIEELGRTSMEIPEAGLEPLQTLQESVRQRGFIIKPIALSPDVRVHFLTTPAGWTYLQAMGLIKKGDLQGALTLLTKLSFSKSVGYGVHCKELQEVLEIISKRDRELVDLEREIENRATDYRNARLGLQVAETAAKSAISETARQSAISMAEAQVTTAKRAADSSIAALTQFVRGEMQKNHSIVQRHRSARAFGLEGECRFLVETLYDTYAELGKLYAMIERVGIAQPDVSIAEPSQEFYQWRADLQKLVTTADKYAQNGAGSLAGGRSEAAGNFSRAHALDKSSLLARAGYGYALVDDYVRSLEQLTGSKRDADKLRQDLEVSLRNHEQVNKLQVFYGLLREEAKPLSSIPFAPVGHVRGLSVDSLLNEGGLFPVSITIGSPETTRETTGRQVTVGMAGGNRIDWFAGVWQFTEIVQRDETRYVRINAAQYGDKIENDMLWSAREALGWLKKVDGLLGNTHALDITLHNLGMPKGGDSAGVTFATCGYSAIKSIPVKSCVAMTGSIRADGAVKPVGGVQQKIAGAFEANGVEVVIVPKGNEADLLFVPVNQLLRLTIIVADNMDTYVKYAMDWPADQLPKDQWQARQALLHMQAAQLLLALGDRMGATELLAGIAESHPEIYNARRLLQLLLKVPLAADTMPAQIATREDVERIASKLSPSPRVESPPPVKAKSAP
jgi:hypothetical protein